MPTVQPCGERQGRLSVSYLNSATLGRRTSLSVYLPPCYVSEPSRVYPVLYLLHGVNADHTQWPDLNVSPEADALTANRAITPLDIVMPNGNRRAAEDYAAFILCDVIPDVKQALLVSRQRTYRAIGGLSRGGYWALYLALLHPDISSAVGGHSPATNAALTEALALNAGGGEQSTLRIYLNVGRNDPLAPDVASLAATAEARHLNVVFHLNDGDHDRA
ncbi:MAG: alpha/beta hydrolase-fold protein [Chloroflexi bacterium]|nr:alpha/beta hydrolase-fold protein [Chloroflexota bacterium]